MKGFKVEFKKWYFISLTRAMRGKGGFFCFLSHKERTAWAKTWKHLALFNVFQITSRYINEGKQWKLNLYGGQQLYC